jgi:hypothetical protein
MEYNFIKFSQLPQLSAIPLDAIVPIVSDGFNFTLPVNRIRTPIIESVNVATRTLSASDFGKRLRCNNASGCEITIPDGIGIEGDYIVIRRLETAGPLTLSLGGSVTVDGASKISEVSQGGECALMAIGINTYDFI